MADLRFKVGDYVKITNPEVFENGCRDYYIQFRGRVGRIVEVVNDWVVYPYYVVFHGYNRKVLFGGNEINEPTEDEIMVEMI